MADRKLPELRTRIRLDTSDLDRAESKIDRFTRSFGDPKAMAGYQQRLKGIGQSADEVGSKLTRNLTLPIAAAGAVSVKLASDFNRTFTTMTSLAGVTTDELASLKAEVSDLARETGKSPTELANALYFIRSAGLDGADALDALEASAKGSAIGLGEAQVVADAATSAVNAYGAENITASQAVDQLAAAVAEGKGEAAAFAPQIGAVLPIAERLGVSFDEVAGSMAYFTKTGTPVAQAATMVQGVLQKLIAPTQQGRDTLKDYGLSLEELQATVSNQGLLAGLQQLNAAVGGDEQALRRVFDDFEGYNGALTLLANNGANAAEVLDAVADSSETVAEAFARVQGTDEFKAQQAITDLQVAAIELGQVLVPLVADLAGGVSDVVSVFDELPEPVQRALLGLVGIAAVIGPMAKGLSLVTTGVSALLKAASSTALDSFRLGLMGVGTEGAGASAKVGGLLNRIGPSGVAAGVAGVGLVSAAFIALQEQSARAKANVDQLVDAMEQGATGEEAFGTQLEKTLKGDQGGFKNLSGSSADLRKVFTEAGVTIEQIKDALTGTDAEFEAFKKKILKGLGEPDYSNTFGNLDLLRKGAEDSKRIFKEKREELEALGVETEVAATGEDELAASTQNLTVQTKEATDALQEEVDAARAVYDAHNAVQDASDAVADAQAELADAQRAAAAGSEENRRAAEAIADAEKGVRDAQLESLDAQRNLTQARADAREELEDLALAASQAQADEQSAAVALDRARSDLLKAKTPLEQREAEARIRQAEEALKQAKDKTGDSAQELAVARLKGVEGSDAVIEAQQRVTAAREGEREAQGRLAEATSEAEKVRVDAARRVQEASENLTDAEIEQIEAQVSLVEATDGIGTSTDVLIVKLTNFARTLDPNSPLRKNLEEYITKLREARGLEDPSNPKPSGGRNAPAIPPTRDPDKGPRRDNLRAPELPSPTGVVPEPEARGGPAQGGNIKVEIPISVTGQPDAATIAQLEATAERVASRVVRQVTVGSGI